MNKIRIAILDSGIHINHPKLFMKNICSIELKSVNNKLEVRNCISDSNGHGTAIAGIIFNKIKKFNEIELLSVKIFNERLGCSMKNFCDALEFVINNCDVNIINLSLGTNVNSIERLKKLCDDASKKNIYIVSAFSNNGCESYPAKFSNVIGVKTLKKVFNEYGYVYDSFNNNVYANGEKQRVLFNNDSFIYSGGNSYACAHFTGILANMMLNFTQDKSFDLKSIITNNSVKEESMSDEGYIEKRENILLYPVSQDNIESLDKLNSFHKVVGFFDFRRFPVNYIEFKNKDAYLLNIKIFNSLNEGLSIADSIYIGDLNFMPINYQKDIYMKIVYKALKLKKNIISKDKILIENYDEIRRKAEKNNIIIISKFN